MDHYTPIWLHSTDFNFSKGFHSTFKDVQSFALSGGNSGALQLKLPTSLSHSNAMMIIRVSGYEYSGNDNGRSWEAILYGYTYSDDRWLNYGATLFGNPLFDDVCFATDGTDKMIILGDISTPWNYPRILINEVQVSYGSQFKANWSEGWEISLETDLSGLDPTFTYNAVIHSEYRIRKETSFYRRLANSLHGGGNITYKNGCIKWTERIIGLGMGSKGKVYPSSGYINLRVPPANTTIKAFASASPDKISTDDGIPLGKWQSLYYVMPHKASINSSNANWRLVGYSTDSGDIPDNWILVAHYHGDNGRIFIAGKDLPLDSKTPEIGPFELRNRHFIFISKTTVSLTTTPAVIATTPIYTIYPNKDLKIHVKVPARNDSTSWGGLYLTTNIEVNGIWYDLGHGGYDGSVMSYDSKMISTQVEEKILKIIDNLNLPPEDSYKIKIELVGRSYDGTTIINGSHNINASSKNIPGRGVLQTWASDQNYLTIFIEELERR